MTNTPALSRKPRDHEIDRFGLSHQGKVRKDNQDHFLIASIHKRTDVQGTNLELGDRIGATPLVVGDSPERVVRTRKCWVLGEDCA